MPTSHARILAWMCVLVAVNQLGFGAMIPTMALYAQSFGVSASAIGMAIAAYGLARFASAIPSGQISDQLGRRPSLAIGGLISGIGNLWCAAATSYPEFIVARFVAGFGAGLILTTGQVVLADISTPERRGRMIGIYQGTFLLAERFGLAAPFVANGVLSLAVMVIAWFAVAETRELSANQPAKDAAPRLPFAAQMRLLNGRIGFVLVSLISLLNAVVRTGGLFALIPLIATTKLGLSVGSIGFAMMLGGVAGLLTSYPAGWLADRFGRKAVIVPATLITGASMLLFCVATSYAGFIAACLVWSIASSVGGSAPTAYAADSAPPGMNAAAISTYRLTADAGYVIGPLALGLIADCYGPVTAIGISAALLAVVGVAFAVLAPETHRGWNK
jgi:MFS transporter, DHA1 family, multidrug resistance protein